MSITLDATLKTAQDGASHHLIAEIKKTDPQEIPFDGDDLSTESTNEKNPNIITHSTGRICTVFVYGTDKLRYIYSDPARESYQTTVTLDDQTDLGLGGAVTITDCSIVELSDATIGLIFTCYDGTNYYLRQSIISVTGAVSSNALIATYAIATYPEVASPYCILLASGDYLLVYIIETAAPAWTIYKRTCNDFSSWSAAAAISITGIYTEEKHNVSLHQIDNDDVFILFDYANDTDITNVYYSVSDDDGATWEAAVAITSYSTSGSIYAARHPIAIQRQNNEIYIVYDERQWALYIDPDTTDWPGGIADTTSIHIYNDHVYMICNNTGAGADALIAIIEIDIASWAITRSWTTTSTPAFNTIFADSDCLWRANGNEGKYIVLGTTTGQVAVLNIDDNTINHYYFFADATYSLDANTDWTPEISGGKSVNALAFAMISDGILYCMFYDQDATTRPIEIVSLDLAQIEAEWKVTQVYFSTNIFTEADLDFLIDNGGSSFKFFKQVDIAIWSVETSSGADGIGKLLVFNITNFPWVILQTYLGWETGAATELPFAGPIYTEYWNGALYLTFPYHSDYDQAGREGICKLDLSTGLSSFIEPTWDDDYDDYKFSHIKLIKGPAGDELLISGDYGITRYNLVSGEWILYDNDSISDLTPDGEDANFFDINYDKTSDLIFCGKFYDAAKWEGLIAVGLEGFLSTPKYKLLEWDVSAYAVYDTTAVHANSKGFVGAVFDGRYIYFSPHNSGALSGQITRYDTQGSFTAAGSYAVYNTTAVHADSKGFRGIVYDGARYIYFVPYKFNGNSGQITRYDTQGSFTAAGSYAVYDTTAVHANSKGFRGGCFDGRYLYLSPHYRGVYHGQVTRYDTQAAFTVASSYEVYDTTAVHADSNGFLGAVYDNSRYVYFIPNYHLAYFGQVTRYDTQGPFTSASSWAVYDTTAVHAYSKGFWNGVFDGRYLYLVPYNYGSYSGQVTRYDTQGSFTAAGSWAVFNTATVNGNSKGFAEAAYDGTRYIYFSPYKKPAAHGQITRYDTQGTFTAKSSWAVYDTTAVHADSKGFCGIVFADTYVYLVPHNNGAYFGQVTRYDTTKNFTTALAWQLGSSASFINGTDDSDAVICLEPTTKKFYVYWTKIVSDELSIKWDKEFTTFDLSSFLPADQDIIIERTIDNKPARLSFSLAKGHLFDESNILSMLKSYLVKGSIITCRLGEIVTATEYWQNQGTFRMKNKSITYRKGAIPIMKVYCEDTSSMLEDMNLITTSYYEGDYPETIIADILENKGSVDSGDIDIDYMDNRTPLYCAWTDNKIMDILLSICDRYGYFIRCDVDNVFKIKKITEDGSTDHTYTDRDSIIEYTPDNNFSDYVNKIIVQAEERLFRKVVYPEKEIQLEHGTIGWWQGTEEIKIPYSDDYSLQCLNPYPIMEYLSGNFLFSGGALTWQLTADASNTFCTLKLTAPVLIDQLIAALAAALATDWIPLVGGALSAVGFLEVFNILASVSNWSATIMAQPIGYIRAGVQGISTDAAFQTKIGRTVERTLKEPLAYTAAQCELVAEHEMMVTRLQRRRVTITKIGHLQDEEGDTVQLIHPISEDAVKLYITSITRRVRIPRKTDTSGGMFDTIEGWKLG